MVTKRKGATGRPNKPGTSNTWLGTMGENVRRLRHRKAWSLVELSEKSAVEMTFLSEFERGLRDISVSELLRVIDALGAKMLEVVPAKTGEADGGVVGSMSASWLSEACSVMNRNIGSVLRKVGEDGRATERVRKRSRIEV